MNSHIITSYIISNGFAILYNKTHKTLKNLKHFCIFTKFYELNIYVASEYN